MFRKRIYLDYASLTPIDPRVVREVKKFSASKYANPSSWYKEGVDAKKAMESARKRVAESIRAHSDEIVFTSGGTEANNLAIMGVYNAVKEQWTRGEVEGKGGNEHGEKRPHLIISNIEHSSIIEVADILERDGCEVTRLAVNSEGIISLDELKKAIKPSTFLVSIMTVNNEIGTIQPIREIAKVIRHARKDKYPIFHTDAAQAVSVVQVNMENLGVDLLTLDGSKIYGPRGIGMLYVKRNTPIKPIVFGGGQESGMRSGTENLPSIMGFAKAVELIVREREVSSEQKIDSLRNLMIIGLNKIDPNSTVNGPSDSTRVSRNILNISIPNIDNEFFVLQLDAKGIACSTKSSCLRDADESYVLKAIGAKSDESVRFSFGRWTKKRDVKRVLAVIKSIVSKK